MSHELDIKVENKYVVEVRLDQSVFTIDVDEHGRPQFTESVLEKVPPYIREEMKTILFEMKFGPKQVHKCVYIDADHQEWCPETKGLGNCNCTPANVSYRSKKPTQQLGISIGEEYVELKYGESVFKLGLKRNGYADFPESVTKELPPEIPFIVAGRIPNMRKNGINQTQIELEIVHDFWCDELAGVGVCRCDPVLRNPDEPKLTQWWEAGWGVLTCVVCHKSYNGDISSYHVRYDWAPLFKRHRITDNHNKVYWEFWRKTLICEDCLRNIMSETHIRFPHVIDDVETSPRVRRRRPIRDRGKLRLVK